MSKVKRLQLQAKPSVRLIPEMRFVCSGIIVGFKVAAELNNKQLTRPAIQVWRPGSANSESLISNPSNCSSAVYSQTGITIDIDEAVCVDGLTENPDNILTCNLNNTFQVKVQPGDILGLRLPSNDSRSSITKLIAAKVAKGPTNYIFVEQLPHTEPTALHLSDRSTESQDLPQITLEVNNSGIKLL